MPYGTLGWVEGKGAATALAGITADADGNPGYTTSGDGITLKKGSGTPMVVGFGATSPTKMDGSALAGNRSRSQMKWLGPGSSNNWPSKGFLKDLRLKFQDGEVVTGYTASNEDEMDLLIADVVYGPPHAYPKTIDEAVHMGGGFKEVYSIDSSLTTTSGSFTAADGREDMDTTTVDDLWLDSDAQYSILGIMPCIGFANGGGVLDVSSLPEAWGGHNPSIPIPEQSGVTFDAGEVSLAYEPIGPFYGDALPQLAIRSSAAGAHLFGLIVGKK